MNLTFCHMAGCERPAPPHWRRRACRPWPPPLRLRWSAVASAKAEGPAYRWRS